jgi:hypothetical protein
VTNAMSTNIDRLFSDAATYFRTTAIRYRSMGSPFYEGLAKLCAEDPELMALAAEAPKGQPYNHIFFGAVHFLVLGNPSDPFARYFGLGARPPVADAATFAALKDFCRRRRAEIATLLKTRTVQYTMVNRASFVVAVIGHALLRGATEPLSLIEVGSSAGLLTVFDHYYYDFGAHGRLGDPACPEINVARFEGKPPPTPGHMPKIIERVGIDLNPIDPRDTVERRWIEGLMPPDMYDDRRLLKQALDARANIPLSTIQGDALFKVPEILPGMTGTICLLHSFCLYQWPAALQNDFHDMLRAQSRGRVIHRLSVDLIHDNPARPDSGPRTVEEELVMDMTAVTYRNGEAEWDFLGRCDTWGRRAQWLA